MSPLSGSFSSKWFSSKGWEASSTHPWLLNGPSLPRGCAGIPGTGSVWLQEQCPAQKRALHSPSASSMALTVFLSSVVQCSVNLRENGLKKKKVCLGFDRSSVVYSNYLVQPRISASVAIHWKGRLPWLIPRVVFVCGYKHKRRTGWCCVNSAKQQHAVPLRPIIFYSIGF